MPSKNTQLRVTSGIILVGLIFLIAFLGQNVAVYSFYFLGALLLDELLVNFSDIKRLSAKWIALMSMYVVGITTLVMFAKDFINIFISIVLVIHVFEMLYLFLAKNRGKNLMDRLFLRAPFVLAIITILEFFGVSSLLHENDWVKYTFIMVLLTIASDTGAWLCGKRFGKTKLWPSVSPNKTVEGAIGGALLSGLVATMAWHQLVNDADIVAFIIFTVLAVISQLGDLVESKIKRQFGVKDSSNIIPGHGGIYDRLDSVLYVAPFYLLAIRVL